MGLSIDNELFYIEDGVLYSVRSLGDSKLVIPEGVTKIDKNWLPFVNGFSFIEEIVIPGSMKVIPMSFFRKRKFKSISISEGVKDVGPFSFVECNKLEKLEIPRSVVKVGECCCYKCSNLNSVILYDTLEKIGANSFVTEEIKDGNVLKKVVLPKEVVLRYDSYLGLDMLVDKFIFSNVSEKRKNIFLDTNIILEGVKLREQEFLKIKKKFMNFGISCVEQKEVKKEEGFMMTLANGVEVLPKMSFMWANFSGCCLPDSVKFIDDYSFCSCKKLEEIEIPSSVEVVGEFLFGNCDSLKKIILYDSLEKIGSGAFVVEEEFDNGRYYTTKLTEEIVLRYSSFDGLLSLINKMAVSGHFDFLDGKVPEFKIVLEGPELIDSEEVLIMMELIKFKVPNIEKKYCNSISKKRRRTAYSIVHW